MVAVSIYALAGHQIVDERNKSIQQLADIDARIADLETHLGVQTIVNKKLIDRTDVSTKLSDMAISEVKQANLDSPEKKVAAASGRTDLCDNFDIVGANPNDDGPKIPSFGPIPNVVYYLYGSYDQISVCRQRKRALAHLFAIGEQLISWQRVLVPVYYFTLYVTFPKYLDRNPQICASYAEIPEEHPNEAACTTAIGEISEYYGTIAESILGCLTMYILPCLYGCIGSSIATLRYMREKVDRYLLNFTDRLVFTQNGIFGIIAGVVVGLFASAFVSTTGPTAALSLSAIAFLAGYNVSGLFAFFDDISKRIFQGGDTPVKAAS
jgi:hypothetical protein